MTAKKSDFTYMKLIRLTNKLFILISSKNFTQHFMLKHSQVSLQKLLFFFFIFLFSICITKGNL